VREEKRVGESVHERGESKLKRECVREERESGRESA